MGVGIDRHITWMSFVGKNRDRERKSRLSYNKNKKLFLEEKCYASNNEDGY